ncbi:DUF3613 domain-containing protein, partial [Pseudomonas sp. SLFW]|uniref:DUF3613 domain-containing protein n=1 Tax=Pseudomonas sp. SLFW TaxID=2683259 RepID=UPI0014129FE2
MKRLLLTGLCMLTLSGTVFAIEPGPSSAAQKQTEDWLQLQASGRAASPIPQPQ